MSELTPDIANAVVEACQAGAEEAAAALGRAFDGEFTLTVGEATTYSSNAVPDGFVAGGLALLMKLGDVAAVAIVPKSSGLLPEWVGEPDASGRGKLDTLAQELGKLLLPDNLEVQSFESTFLAQADKSLALAKVGDNAALVPLEVTQGEQSGHLSLIWPLEEPGKLSASNASSAANGESSAKAEPRKIPTSFEELPAYSRSLLRVQVPVRVILASRKETLKDVVEMSPGTIIKFEKPCDHLLEMRVADQSVAEGEAVKVGDKFGFRVISMLLPEEHFLKIKGKKAS